MEKNTGKNVLNKNSPERGVSGAIDTNCINRWFKSVALFPKDDWLSGAAGHPYFWWHKIDESRWAMVCARMPEHWLKQVDWRSTSYCKVNKGCNVNKVQSGKWSHHNPNRFVLRWTIYRAVTYSPVKKWGYGGSRDTGGMGIRYFLPRTDRGLFSGRAPHQLWFVKRIVRAKVVSCRHECKALV